MIPAPYTSNPTPKTIGGHAAIGAVAGLLLGGLVGTLTERKGADTSMGGRTLWGAVGGTAAGAAMGAVVGKHRLGR